MASPANRLLRDLPRRPLVAAITLLFDHPMSPTVKTPPSVPGEPDERGNEIALRVVAGAAGANRCGQVD